MNNKSIKLEKMTLLTFELKLQTKLTGEFNFFHVLIVIDMINRKYHPYYIITSELVKFKPYNMTFHNLHYLIFHISLSP